MKIVLPKTTGSTKSKKAQPVILYEQFEPVQPKKHESLTFKLRSNPTDKDSTTYELTLRYFKAGTPVDWLKLLKDLKVVFLGQNVQDAKSKFTMVRRLLQGDTLTAFNTKAKTAGIESDKTFEQVLQSTTAYVFPKKALQR